MSAKAAYIVPGRKVKAMTHDALENCNVAYVSMSLRSSAILPPWMSYLVEYVRDTRWQQWQSKQQWQMWFGRTQSQAEEMTSVLSHSGAQIEHAQAGQQHGHCSLATSDRSDDALKGGR
jgi:hypothetical protein